MRARMQPQQLGLQQAAPSPPRRLQLAQYPTQQHTSALPQLQPPPSLKLLHKLCLLCCCGLGAAQQLQQQRQQLRQQQQQQCQMQLQHHHHHQHRGQPGQEACRRGSEAHPELAPLAASKCPPRSKPQRSLVWPLPMLMWPFLLLREPGL
jgi:hypothetical protein